MCYWYNEFVKDGIPIINSKIYNTKNNWSNVKNILKKNLKKENQFIRFCNASPKDICMPIFNINNIEKIVNTFKNSNRTGYMMNNENHDTHLIIRDLIPIDYEVRCFWHNYKLRAVSGPLFYICQN